MFSLLRLFTGAYARLAHAPMFAHFSAFRSFLYSLRLQRRTSRFPESESSAKSRRSTKLAPVPSAPSATKPATPSVDSVDLTTASASGPLPSTRNVPATGMPADDELLTLDAFLARTTTKEELENFYTQLHTRASGAETVFISLTPLEKLSSEVAALQARDSTRSLPLHGVPFVVKDNIDYPPLPTTAACPSFAYHPSKPAFVVKLLTDAGAIVVGKSNMDQFASGLVGTRSPYGTPHNACDVRYVPGGSSSGSAVAVAQGMCVFALSTDTAGSGRVPAAMNGIVGVKPTKGLVSTSGVVPAAESLDCVGVLAANVADAAFVLQIIAKLDESNVFARAPPPEKSVSIPRGMLGTLGAFKFGVPAGDGLTFCEDDVSERSFSGAVKILDSMGGMRVDINYDIFRDAASLLYGGPFVAERYAAHGDFIRANKELAPSDFDPIVSKIILDSETHPAWSLFAAQKRVREYIERAKKEVWADVQVLFLPSIPRPITIEELKEDPLQLNSMLGTYTNFVNLMDYCAVAVPAPRVAGDEVPRGVTFVGEAFEERSLLALAQNFETRMRVASSETSK